MRREFSFSFQFFEFNAIVDAKISVFVAVFNVWNIRDRMWTRKKFNENIFPEKRAYTVSSSSSPSSLLFTWFELNKMFAFVLHTEIH